MIGRKAVLVTGGSGFIGTHLIDCLNGDYSVVNLDVAPPLEPSHNRFWTKCNILDRTHLTELINQTRPTHVVHLAACTDSSLRNLDNFRVNTLGTQHLVDALRTAGSVTKAVFFSTQFVCGPGRVPRADDEYRPHTVYGESKVIAEAIVRRANPPFAWTIARPTNVWGPWHPRYPNEFWKVLKRGLYVHPGQRSVVRSYGYVGNVAAQARKILDAPRQLVHKKTYYLGDAPIELLVWVNAFAQALTGRPVRVVPRSVIRALALAGDAFSFIGFRAPLKTSRFRSMTEDYITPMDKTFRDLGTPPVTLEEGVEATVNWLKAQDPWWSR